jgi:tetratricopeptide (TPR) repeat protein
MEIGFCLMKIEKTVFISYRRTNSAWALAVYQNLTKNDYDVFFDYNSINSGDFEQIIIGNIKSRAHFILILTPSALERCNEPNDWLRREIETAIDEKRNIVPLMFDGFDYGSPSIANYLTGKLALLKNYNAQRVPVDFFEEAMGKICNRHLNIALEMVIHPLNLRAQKTTDDVKKQASKEPIVNEQALTAVDWFEKAYKYIEAKEFNEALRCYKEAIRLKPNFVEAINNYAIACNDTQQYKKAILAANEAIRVKSDFPYSYNTRGIARKNTRDYEGAIADFTKAISIKPDFAQAYNNRANTFSDMRDYERAIADFTKAISIKPDFAQAYNNRGAARTKKGDIDGALDDYARSIALKNPELHKVYNNRGSARREAGEYIAAIADYNLAISLNPNYAEAYNNRGYSYEKAGDITKAMEDYSQAIALKPDFAEAYFNRGVLSWQNSKDYLEALNDLETAINLDSDYQKARDAVETLKQAVNVNALKAEKWWEKAINYINANEDKEAINCLSEVITLLPEFARAYDIRGDLKKFMGDLNGAIADYTDFIHFTPNDIKGYQSRAIAYYHLGNYKMAQADWEIVLKIDPNNEDAQHNLELAKKML